MSFRQSLIASAFLASAVAAWGLVAAAGLPTVSPPEDPPEEKNDAGRRQSAVEARVDALTVQIQQRARGQNAAAAPDIDSMLKLVGDTHRPVSIRFDDRLNEAADFGRLDHEQQTAVVPELLQLLESHSPLPYVVVLPNRKALEVRHRANAALIRLADICYGQITEKAEDEAEEAEGPAGLQPAEVVARWKAWWNEVKDLDDEGRLAVASCERLKLIRRGAEPALRINLTTIGRVSDVAALDTLMELLNSPEGLSPARRRHGFQIIQRLATNPEASLQQQMALFDLLRRLNVPEASSDAGAITILASALHRITGKPPALEVVTVAGPDGKEAKVRLVKAESIEAWRQAFAQRAGEARQASPTNQGEDHEDTPGTVDRDGDRNDP
jgi:hypothetical protein